MRESGSIPRHAELDAAIEQIITMEESPDTEQQEINDDNGGKCHVKNVQNLAGPATAPTDTSSGFAEFFVDATANSNSGYGGIIRETCS